MPPAPQRTPLPVLLRQVDALEQISKPPLKTNQTLFLQFSSPFLLVWQVDALERISDLTDLALYGTVLGWFVGLTNPRRFAWLFSR